METRPQTKPERVFIRNQEVVQQLTSLAQTRIGRLQVNPVMNGSQISQIALPLAAGESFMLDLSEIETFGGKLKDVITKACKDHGIKVPSEDMIGQASFTPVTVALAGQHLESDAACQGEAKAAFLPAFYSDAQQNEFVFALSYTAAFGMRVDHLRVEGKPAQLSNRHGKENKNTSLATSGIAGDACMVIFVEYDSKEHEIRYRSGDGEGVWRENTLTRISAYLVCPKVINVDERQVSAEECSTLVQTMQGYANQLGAPYKNYCKLTMELNTHVRHHDAEIVPHVTDIFEYALLKLAGVTEELTFWSYSQSVKTPAFFFMDVGLSAEGVALFVKNLQGRFGKDFCEHVPQWDAEKELEHSARGNTGQNKIMARAVRFSTAAVLQQIDVIKLTIDTILASKTHMRAYRLYCDMSTFSTEGPYGTFSETLPKQAYSNFRNLQKLVKKLAKTHGLSTGTDCVEIALLKMFNCSEQLTTARFAPGVSVLGKMLNVYFSFDISEQAARSLVEQINTRFSTLKYPPYASFIRADAQVSGKEGMMLRQISLSTEFFFNNEISELLTATWNQLSIEEPKLFEELQRQSVGFEPDLAQYQRQPMSTILSECSRKLSDVASHYQQPSSATESAETAQVRLKFVNSLSIFSRVLSSTEFVPAGREAASDQVRRSMAAFEAEQSAAENDKFQGGDKQVITDVQKTLGLRK